ncbi:MAG TPA: neutral/alkaline non-lysosomal ceramidase N-terminal domain-containing protein [Acidobacteriota bacterium]|jgi:hypothetical protein
MKRHLLLPILAISLTTSIQAAEFRAAVGKTDITPPLGYELWGYAAREKGAVAVLDPLYARALVLDDGTIRLALVTLDLGRTFGPAAMDRLRNRVRTSAGVQQVYFLASHTHSGPVIEDSYADNKLPPWESEALNKIGAAIEQAVQRMAPCRIGTGQGQTYIGYNRRTVQLDGSPKMLWRNPTKLLTSPVDPTVGVIRVDDMSGKPVAILVHYSCHAVVFGADNLRYSADFPGVMAKTVEDAFDNAPICFFLQGAPGDINPYFATTRLEEDADRMMKETGEQLGKEAVRVARSVSTKAPAKPSLKHALDVMNFPIRWDMEKTSAIAQAMPRSRSSERYLKSFSDPVSCPVMTLLINDEIALAGMPGEPFVEFAIDFRSRSPAKNSFLVGYANGYSAYFPTIRDAVIGGYGADSLTTRVEVGAGEAMVNHAIVSLYKMLGLLKPVPSR